MLRFVILRHDPGPASTRGRHWDLMLEHAGGLATWALEDEPALGRRTRACRLADHRAAYLRYEGPVSGGRGEVHQWDRGRYELRSDVREGRAAETVQTPFQGDACVVLLDGQRLRAFAELTRLADDPQRWVVSFSEPDSVARTISS